MIDNEPLHTTRARAEREAATQLGLLIFEFSRLDMELALHLVWTDEGNDLERLTNQLNESAISRKLELMQRHAARKYADQSEPFGRYKAWLEEADLLRVLRNELIHGRWGPWGREMGLTNVIGIPTSSEQREVNYTVQQLEQFVARINALRMDHAEIRKKWPL